MGKTIRERSEGDVRWIAAAVLLAGSSCGGGGGGGGGVGLSASFATAGTEAPETGTGTTLEIVLSVPWGELAEDLELFVQDTGTGTATAVYDYQPFDTLTVTFPAGSLDGAVRSVVWLPVDDASSEGSETIDLQLVRVGADGGAVVGTGSMRILDDESATLAVAQGTRDGALLPNGAALDMGNQTIGVPTDVGIDVWLDNIGAATLHLSSPVLVSGSTASFHLEQGEALGATAVAPELFVVPFPLLAAGSAAVSGSATSVPLRASPELLAELEAAERIVLAGVPVPGSLPLDLELERVPLPVRPGSVLAVDGEPEVGGLERLLEGVTLWSGHVAGDGDAQAFLSFSEHGSRGWIRTGPGEDETLHLVPSATDGSAAALVLGAGSAQGAEVPALCGGVLEVPGREPAVTLAPAATVAGDRHTPYVCRLALETDYQLYERFGDVTDLTTYVAELVGAVSARFDADVGTSFQIVYLGVHTTPADPWTTPDGGGDVQDLLLEFQGTWAPMWGGAWPASADLAHFLSGASIGGGIAYVNALCSENWGFGVSASLNGLVDWGSYAGGASAMYWDFDVLAHELGHGFNARHTHEYCPPLDTCALGCQGQLCQRGTIMSYCHACPGGVANVDLEFHPLIANEMRRAVNTTCLARKALDPGQAAFFRVFFRPEASPGRHTAVLELEHDADSSPSPYRITLYGTAETGGAPAGLPLGDP